VKVQILSLDAHDDRNSVLDRLGWVQATRVVLVWPSEGSPLRSHLDLLLVHRRARSRRVQLGLVTHDPAMREAARALKIPVFASAESFPERQWRRRRLPPLPSLRRSPTTASLRDLRPSPAPAAAPRTAARLGRVVVFCLALAAIGAALFAALPSAEVVLDPLLTEQSATLEVLISAEGQVTAGGTFVPAAWRNTRATGQLRVPTSGSARVPAAFAVGNVTFTNLTTDTVDLPWGTGLRSAGADGVRFVTTEAARLPAEPGATVEVTIAAVAPGSSGNVPAGEITAVEGGLGLQVAAANAEPTTGGSQAARAAVSASDLRTAYEALLADLRSQAAFALRSELLPGEALAEDSLRVTEEYQRTYDAQPGDAADTLALTLDLQMAGLVYREEALQEAALASLDQPGDCLEAVPGSTSVHVIDGPITDRRGRTTVSLEARRQMAAPFDPVEVAAHIAGRPVESASEWLAETYDLRRPATIHMRPRFLPWLPLLPFRITVHADWETTP
jgi:hypothetical protein